MDGQDAGRNEELRKKLQQLLKDVAEVEVELSRSERAIVGVPHYSVIESRAHDWGRLLSREIQVRQMRELCSESARTAKCPTCQRSCQIRDRAREVSSIDGPLELIEPCGYCPVCRRDFFPSAGNDGLWFSRIDAPVDLSNGRVRSSNTSLHRGCDNDGRCRRSTRFRQDD